MPLMEILIITTNCLISRTNFHSENKGMVHLYIQSMKIRLLMLVYSYTVSGAVGDDIHEIRFAFTCSCCQKYLSTHISILEYRLKKSAIVKSICVLFLLIKKLSNARRPSAHDRKLYDYALKHQSFIHT